MPKIAAPKPDYTEKQFAAALKRAGFAETTHPTLLKCGGTRRFRVGDIAIIPGIYEGRFGAINLRLTLKHLQSVAALQAELTKKNLAPQSTPPRAIAPASSDADPDFFPTPPKA